MNTFDNVDDPRRQDRSFVVDKNQFNLDCRGKVWVPKLNPGDKVLQLRTVDFYDPVCPQIFTILSINLPRHSMEIQFACGYIQTTNLDWMMEGPEDPPAGLIIADFIDEWADELKIEL